jgi:hypothetical protein
MNANAGLSIRARVLLFLAATVLLTSAIAGFVQYQSYLTSIDAGVDAELQSGVKIMDLVLQPSDHGHLTPDMLKDPVWSALQAQLNTLHTMIGTKYLYSQVKVDGKWYFDYYDTPTANTPKSPS